MRPTTLFVLPTLILIFAGAQPAFAKLEVHEWGTFTSLVGSDGVTQNGMYHEDEPLPGFVHGFGEIAAAPIPPPPPLPPSQPSRPCHFKGCFEQNFLSAHVVTQKMETPVLYFYSDHTQDVSVNVKFPKGVITETYPAPIATSPTRDTVQNLENGNTTFKIQVIVPGTPGTLPNDQDYVPYVDVSNIYSHARNVASNVIKANGNEREKFIFYRGVGQYQPAFSISSDAGSLTIAAAVGPVPQSLFLVDVDQGGQSRLMKINPQQMRGHMGRYVNTATLDTLRNHAAPDDSQFVSGEKASAAIVDGLVQAGLHIDEAVAMVSTWGHGYLKVPGLRLLSILPRAEVDSLLPLTITPTPDHVERAFVSRIEILLDTDEQKILADVRTQGMAFDVTTLGRFAEPKLRRVYEVYLQSSVCGPDGFAATTIRANLKALIAKAMSVDEKSGSGSIQ